MIAAVVKVIHGANSETFALPTRTPISVVKASLLDAFNIPRGAVTYVNGHRVPCNYRLLGNDTLEFIVRNGRKGAAGSGEGKKRPLYTEEMKNAAAEILQACQSPESLVVSLARLVRRQKRKGVISDNWSYRNQLLILQKLPVPELGTFPFSPV